MKKTSSTVIRNTSIEHNNEEAVASAADHTLQETENNVNNDSEKKLRGYLGRCDENGIFGWIIDDNNPNERVKIDVFIDDELITQATANIFRQDLLDNGIGDGQHGFHIPMPANLFDNLEHKVEIKDVLTGLLLRECSKSFTIKSSLKGSLDICDERGIAGWVIDTNKLNEPVVLDIFIDGELITQTAANFARKDLLSAGIGNGHCGFNASIPAKFFNAEEHKIEIYEEHKTEIYETTTGLSLPCFASEFKLDFPFYNDNLIQPIDQITILGCVEYEYPTLIYGWAFSQAHKPLTFSVLINNREYFQKVEWIERHEIAEKYGNTALYSHFKIIPSKSLKEAMSKAMLKNEDIIVLVNGQELPKANERVFKSSGLKLAVVVHAYYEDQLEIIDNYLQNIDFFFDLFITVPENVVEKLRPKLDELFFRRELRIVKNIGNDVAPFLDLVNELDQRGYDLVCKLHTKRDHEQYKGLWRDCMLDGVLGSRPLVAEVIQAFKECSELSLIGPALTYISARMSIYDAGDKLRSMTSLLLYPDQKIDDWGFFAGTMFWARVSMFRPLQNTAMNKMQSFSISKSGELIGTAHLFERIFGLLPYIQQNKIGLVDYKTIGGECSQYLKILDKPLVPRQRLSKNMNIFSLIKKEIWTKWSALNYYNFLDKRWYFIKNQDVISNDADCLFDFLVEKNEQGYLNQEHEDSQITIRFEKDKIYLDSEDVSHLTSVNWPEVSASEFLFPEQNILKIKKINSDIKVSIICITYNHEKYIRQALDGFINQRTNFRFEVIIGDDASTDNTQAVISEYAEKFPDIFVPVLRSTNIGARNNFMDLCSRIKGGFVALNEGDDYWTDPNKLQMQADYLDGHPQCTLCFHLVKVLNEINPKKNSIFPIDPVGEVFQLDDIVKSNFIQTNSVMYRWGFHDGFGDDYNVNAIPGDHYLHSLHAALGEIHLIPKIMAVYRRHSGGMFSEFSDDHLKLLKKWGAGHIELFRTLDRKFNNKYTENYLSKELSILRTLIPEYWQDANFEGIANIAINYSDTAQIVFDKMNINIDLHNVKDELDLKKELRNNYKISVLVTSYNHASHLSTCLDNILSQQGFFSLEVIIADDDSSDGSREIAEDYAVRYPETIRVLSKTSNMGMLKNMKRGFDACTGNFIAICEGDDYWLSEMKLHKQLWMLIHHPELSMCFNWLLLHYEEKETFIPHQQQANINKEILTFEDLIKEPLTSNFSCCMYHAKTIRKIPRRYYNEERAADWLFNLCAATIGDIGFLKETLSVYRIHEKGQWSGLSQFEMNNRKIQAGLQFQSYFPNKILPNQFISTNEKIIKQVSSTIACHVQNVKIQYNCLFLEGWIIDKNIKSTATEDKTLLVRDLHNRLVHSQLIENRLRHDVDAILSPKEKGRHAWAGFFTVFSENTMKPGEYKLFLGLSSGFVPVRRLLVLADGTFEVKAL